jgi:hypothetical protein
MRRAPEEKKRPSSGGRPLSAFTDYGEIFSAKVAENVHLAASLGVAAAFRSASSVLNASSFFFHSAA